MALSSRELSLQMLAQLRLLDPSISAEIGTSERKIIDTVSQSLYDSQIDLEALSTALDVDTKYGAALDRFFRLFGFARQQATYATGYVTLGRIVASNLDIRIPAGTTIEAAVELISANDWNTISTIRFATVYDVILPAGQTSVVAAIRSTIPGTVGNVAANMINNLTSTPYGITEATNDIPTSNGVDAESDAEFKIRFKNTVFRNLAGTQDQYMALAVSTSFTSKANVVGPQSRYKEHIQVPPVADDQSYDVGGLAGVEAGGGSAGEYSTALSTIPYAKYIYETELPTFVSNQAVGIGSFFYRQDYDFTFNSSDPYSKVGDAARYGAADLDVDILTFSGVNPAAIFRPSVTFTSVYTGSNENVQAITPGQIALLDFAYMSDASRNDFTRNITNAVDVFIDGGNEVSADTIIPLPPASTHQFLDAINSKYHYENYRRIGEPAKRPVVGNILTPLYWEPVLTLPAEIVVGTDTYIEGIHYWAVEDVSQLVGSVRARSGIEWSTTIHGKLSSDTSTNPAIWGGAIITSNAQSHIPINGYTYDKNVTDLQVALENAKQVTTDVLAHRSKKRYFKLDIAVMYANGVSTSEVNAQIRDSVDSALKSQYFGVFIQLSDLLQVIHNVPGVDNVRWNADAPNNTTTTKVYECDNDGNAFTNASIERTRIGNGSSFGDIWQLYVTGQPTGGSFTVTYNGFTSAPISIATLGAASIQAALAASPLTLGATVTEDFRTTTDVRYPIRSFQIDWSGESFTPVTPTLGPFVDGSLVTGGPQQITNDFFLRDDELAQLPAVALGTDTLPGLIIRPRAQQTWTRSN